MPVETKILEIRADFGDLVAKIATINTSTDELTKKNKELKKSYEENAIAIAENNVQIAKNKTEVKALTNELVNETKVLAQRAAEIDKNVAKELAAQAKLEQQAAKKAKLAMQVENEDRRRQGMIERNSQAETLAAQKAEQQAAKKVGYINELRLSVDRLEQEYYQLTKAELDNVNVGGKMLADLTSKRAELSKIQQSYGKHTLEVGNYGSATKMLGINLGQIMKEMPNFAISARIGIMSLTNNIPMVVESIKAVREETMALRKTQQLLVDQGKMTAAEMTKMPNIFKSMGAAIFSVTGIASLFMVALQLWGPVFIDWVSSLVKGTDAVDNLAESIKRLNSQYDNSKTIMEQTLKLQDVYIEKRSIQIENEIDAENKRYEELEGRELASLQANKSMGIKYNKERLTELEKLEAEHYKKISQLSDDLVLVRKQEQKADEDAAKKKAEDDKKKQKALADKLQKERDAFNWEQKIREATAKAIKDDEQREIADVKQKYVTKNTEASAAFAKDASKKKEYDALIVAYEAEQKRELSDINDKYRDKEIKWMDDLIKYFEKIGEDQRKELAKLNREDYNEFVKSADAKVQKEKDRLEISLMQNNDSLQQHINLLDSEKEAAILLAIEKNESVQSIEDFYNEKKLQTAREYRYKEQMETMQYVEAAGRIFSELSNFTSALGERELQDYDKTIQGKINHDELYGKKKAEIETRNAILQRSVASFGVIVNTAGAIMKLAEQLGVAALPLQIAEGILGATQLATIWSAPLPSYNGGGSGSTSNVTKTTVTERFHSGGLIGGSGEVPITALGGESVMNTRSTAMFAPILSTLNQMGGGKAITSGVGNTSTSGEEMMTRAFAKALMYMPAPQVSVKDINRGQEKMTRVMDNLIVK